MKIDWLRLPNTTFMALLSLSGCLCMPVWAQDQTDNLASLYQHARLFDNQIRQAEAERDIAAAQLSQAKAAYRPQINAQATFSRNQFEIQDSPFAAGSISEEYNQQSAQLNASQNLLNYAALNHIKAAKARFRQAEAAWKIAQSQLIIRLTQNYLAVLAAQDAVRFSQAELEAVRSQLDQIQQKFDLGAAAITDLKEAQARADSANANYLATQNQLLAAEEGLKLMIGKDRVHPAPLKTDIAWQPLQPNDPEAWLDKARQQNNAMQAALAAAQSADANRKAASGELLPTLALIASHQYNKADGGLFNEGTNNTTIVGLQLNVPLYNGGARYAERQAAALRQQQARDNLTYTQLNIASEVRTAFQKVASSLAIVHALQQSLISAQAAYDATAQGQALGTRTTADVLTSLSALYAAQRNLANARYEFVMANMQLLYLCGELSPAWLDTASSWSEWSE